MLDCLRQVVEMESPTNSKAEVDRLGNFLARELKRSHAKVQILKHARAGAAVLAELFGKSGRGVKPILLLGHLDTVWALGMLSRMPVRVRRDRDYGAGIPGLQLGPGCAESAGGVAQARD